MSKSEPAPSTPLLPCPFCGNLADLHEGFVIVCRECEAMVDGIDAAAAYAAWNRRSTYRAAAPALVREAREFVETHRHSYPHVTLQDQAFAYIEALAAVVQAGEEQKDNLGVGCVPEPCPPVVRASRDGPVSSAWRHKKRGTVYEVIGTATFQCATEPPDEGAGLVVYRGEDGQLWARRHSEFHDGRFEPLMTGKPPAADGEGR